jgi:hypothetical protein
MRGFNFVFLNRTNRNIEALARAPKPNVINRNISPSADVSNVHNLFISAVMAFQAKLDDALLLALL